MGYDDRRSRRPGDAHRRPGLDHRRPGRQATDNSGDIDAEGTAQYVGGLVSVRIDKPIAGDRRRGERQGDVVAATDVGVCTYGDARFLGTLAGVRLNGPVIAIQHLGSVTAPACARRNCLRSGGGASGPDFGPARGSGVDSSMNSSRENA